MIEAVSKNIKNIIAACDEMQVKSFYLFGSGARETDFKDDSDLDFIYRFVKNESGYPIAGFDYFDLLFKLEEITGRKVDLVAEEKIRNRFFFEKNKERGDKNL
ncbi:MAG: nucleotidyltransferase domain-containing protein [Agriterribacter sp.]